MTPCKIEDQRSRALSNSIYLKLLLLLILTKMKVIVQLTIKFQMYENSHLGCW